MTRPRAVLEVARWEFRRFFKLRDQVVSLAITFAMAAGSYGVARWMATDDTRPKLALADVPDAWRTAIPDDIELIDPHGRDVATLKQAVAGNEMDGVLTAGPSGPLLWVRKPSGWCDRVAAALRQQHQRQRLAAAGIAPAELQALLAPLPVHLEQVSGSEAGNRAERWAAVLVGALLLIGLLSGVAFMFVGITGEKQLRVTEQVVSAISAQSWIDGKILGLSGVSALTAAGYLASSLVLALGSRWAGWTWPWPDVVARPGLLAVMGVLALLGFAFWNTFMAALAATITDPNTSSRGGFIMLPTLPVVFAVMAMGNPDTTAMRVLSVLPPTAPFVMLTRLVVGEPTWWEIALALSLLAAGTWALRVIAGRVFRVGMLTYGKEPSWRELWRWARDAS